jgi:hypothetical protein
MPRPPPDFSRLARAYAAAEHARPRRAPDARYAVAARVLREKHHAKLYDLAVAMLTPLDDARTFLRRPEVRDELARMLGAVRVAYTTARLLRNDVIEAVFL